MQQVITANAKIECNSSYSPMYTGLLYPLQNIYCIVMNAEKYNDTMSYQVWMNYICALMWHDKNVHSLRKVGLAAACLDL